MADQYPLFGDHMMLILHPFIYDDMPIGIKTPYGLRAWYINGA
jgi:hypothetical protein